MAEIEELRREVEVLRQEISRLKGSRFGPSIRIAAWNDSSPRGIIGEGVDLAQADGITLSKDGSHIEISGTSLRTWAFFTGGNA
jgi:hypothetical protein